MAAPTRRLPRIRYTWTEDHPELRNYVARIIREARLGRDLSPNEAAAEVGISRSAWYRWERGDIGGHTALLIQWLLGDVSTSMDPIYWRERALMAEDALEKIGKSLDRYGANAREILQDEVGSRR